MLLNVENVCRRMFVIVLCEERRNLICAGCEIRDMLNLIYNFRS
jgi:hypothetical protein